MSNHHDTKYAHHVFKKSNIYIFHGLNINTATIRPFMIKNQPFITSPLIRFLSKNHVKYPHSNLAINIKNLK